MGALTLTNKAKTANFEYTEDLYVLTGVVRTHEDPSTIDIESGVITKEGVACGNFYTFHDGDSIKTNLYSVKLSELNNIGVVVSECISSLMTTE